MEPQETTALALAARDGDTEAFTALMQMQKQQLYRMAFRYLHNEADALEALQEVTCRAYTRIGRLKEPRYVSTWLYRIMINYCMDEKKKRQRRERLSQAGKAHLSPEVSSGDTESARVDKMMMQAAVERLELPYQTVIQLKYYHDLTIPEIARTMEKPEGTIKTWLNKALKGLRSRLDKEGDSHG